MATTTQNIGITQVSLALVQKGCEPLGIHLVEYATAGVRTNGVCFARRGISGEYVTWTWYITEEGFVGFESGHYIKDRDQAVEDFKARIR